MNEVKLNDGSQSTANVGFSTVVADTEDNDDKDWTPLNEAGGNLGLLHDDNQPQTISEKIVQVSIDSTSAPTSLKVVPEIRYTVPPKHVKEDPAIYGQ